MKKVWIVLMGVIAGQIAYAGDVPGAGVAVVQSQQLSQKKLAEIAQKLQFLISDGRAVGPETIAKLQDELATETGYFPSESAVYEAMVYRYHGIARGEKRYKQGTLSESALDKSADAWHKIADDYKKKADAAKNEAREKESKESMFKRNSSAGQLTSFIQTQKPVVIMPGYTIRHKDAFLEEALNPEQQEQEGRACCVCRWFCWGKK